MTPVRKDTFDLVTSGDSIITREILPYEGDRSFDTLLDIVRTADVSVTNLEVLVHDYEGYPASTSGGTYMRAPPYVLDELSGMGFDMFSAATNHSFDYSHGGIETTVAHLKERDMAFAGLGRNLFEAQRPAYKETPGGRVGLVSACTSFPAGSEAGRQSSTLSGRPGLNPIHVSTVYAIPDKHLEMLEEISEIAGIEAVKRDWFDRGILYGHDWTQQEFFHFHDLKFEAALNGKPGISYHPDEDDVTSYCSWIETADSDADWVIASIHTHQGVDGLSTTSQTPEFLTSIARKAIDAGADVVVCHGPHVLRGMEVYGDRPIFYSLGNFIVQNETVSRLPPESFARYNLTDLERVGDVFQERLYEGGEPAGDLANDRFWRTIIPRCTFSEGSVSIEIYPCTLHQHAGRPQRGIPTLATGFDAQTILDEFADLSTHFGTDVSHENGVGRVEIQ